MHFFFFFFVYALKIYSKQSNVVLLLTNSNYFLFEARVKSAGLQSCVFAFLYSISLILFFIAVVVVLQLYSQKYQVEQFYSILKDDTAILISFHLGFIKNKACLDSKSQIC